MAAAPFDTSPERNLEGAIQLLRLALDDAAQVECLLGELANELARHGMTAASEADAASSPNEFVFLRGRHVACTNALMVAGARQLADIGDLTRARFSRILTEHLASGRGELPDGYRAYFSVLPNRNTGAADAMQNALTRGDEALEDALQRATDATREAPRNAAEAAAGETAMPPPRIAAPRPPARPPALAAPPTAAATP